MDKGVVIFLWQVRGPVCERGLNDLTGRKASPSIVVGVVSDHNEEIICGYGKRALIYLAGEEQSSPAVSFQYHGMVMMMLKTPLLSVHSQSLTVK